MKVSEFLCKKHLKGCFVQDSPAKQEDLHGGNSVRIDLYSMIMNLVGSELHYVKNTEKCCV